MSLLASLRSTAGTLRAFEQVLSTSQNNVANASTPGFARQRVGLVAERFRPEAGLPGGVSARPPVSQRDEFAEQNVRRQTQARGASAARAEMLAPVEGAFDISGRTGIPASLDKLWQSFSAWAFAPNDRNARQAVLDRARDLGQVFRDAAAMVNGSSEDANLRLSQTIDQVNSLSASIAKLNLHSRQGDRDDGGLEASMNDALEQLSELVDVTALRTSDGSITVLAGGSVPLVVGGAVYELGMASAPEPQALYPDGPPHMAVLDAGGDDITARLRGGRLYGLLEVRNVTLPRLLGDGSQPGELNRLAEAVAARVNELLNSGQTPAGRPPAGNLFLYDAANRTGVAASLQLNEDLGTDELAAADPGPPFAANGIALRLAGLGRPTAAEDKLDGISYAEFYAGLAAAAGRDVAGARHDEELGAQLVAQARNLRQAVSGVSLDEEAMAVVQFQRAYQAAAKMITILDELTETTVNLLR